MPKPPLPSGATILYFPSVWPLKSNVERVQIDNRACAMLPTRFSTRRSLAAGLDPRMSSHLAAPTRRVTSRACCASAQVTRSRCSTGGAASSARSRRSGGPRHGVTAPVGRSRRRAEPPPVADRPRAGDPQGRQHGRRVRDATMMGAESIEPLLTAHADVKASAVQRPGTLERWNRIALASAKQSRRATLPQIHRAAYFRRVDLRTLGWHTADLRGAVRRLRAAAAQAAARPRRPATGCRAARS